MFCTDEYSCVSFSIDAKPWKTVWKDELESSFCTVCERLDVTSSMLHKETIFSVRQS